MKTLRALRAEGLALYKDMSCGLTKMEICERTKNKTTLMMMMLMRHW